jgi:hypothetical protein
MMFEVREPGGAAWDTAIEQATQDGPPCVLDDDGAVVVIVLPGKGMSGFQEAQARAQRIAGLLAEGRA